MILSKHRNCHHFVSKIIEMGLRKYSEKTLKILFAKCGNQCAFPGCEHPVVVERTEQSEAMIGAQIAHIYAASNSGPRGKSGLTSLERNSVENLVLFCPTHHVIVDGQHETFTADTLRSWKAEVEASSSLKRGAYSRLQDIANNTLKESGRIFGGASAVELAAIYCTRDCETEISDKLLHCEGPYLIAGAAGSGKTSLLWRIAQRLKENGNPVLFLRADFLVSDEGFELGKSLLQVSFTNKPSFLLIDSADTIVGDSTLRVRFQAQVDFAVSRGHRVAFTCRTADRDRYFPELQSFVIPSEYSTSEFQRIIYSEPPRDCRRLQLLRRWSHYEQDNEQVFNRSTRPCGADGFGP